MLDAIGWIGSAILVLSLVQTRILRLRILNLTGCLIHTGFNLAIGVWPMVGLNVVLAVVNIVQLRRLLKERHASEGQNGYDVVSTDVDAPVLRRLLTRHHDEIAKLHGVEPAELAATEAYLVLRGDETVGAVLLADDGNGTARLTLDHVVERYRDFTPGEHVFRRSGILDGHGYDRIVTRPGITGRTATYYETIGFTRDAATDEFVLAVPIAA
ncbi:hypothetical protein [Sanguibacter sp. HDW7]|uniref:hypothetical protein n=1 Tax=Sanguibacter sp. HDW7 TaxID=2714931 RepID=UPI00140D0850|nr:hypothetical protein [Sanguibacter sp. HDW7]QIK84600.1 hypothetical protein G7063_14010 [Sanguibacter sp. HDW7]